MVVICCHIYLWLITYPCMKIEKPQDSLDRGQINCPVWPEIAQDLEQLTTPFRSFRSLFLLVQSTSITIYPQGCWLHPLFCAAAHLFLPQICCIWHLHPCWSLYWWNHHFCGSKSPFSWSIVFPKSTYACFFPKDLLPSSTFDFIYITYIINIYILFPSFSIFIVSTSSPAPNCVPRPAIGHPSTPPMARLPRLGLNRAPKLAP